MDALLRQQQQYMSTCSYVNGLGTGAAGIALVALLAQANRKYPLIKWMIHGVVVIAAGVILVKIGEALQSACRHCGS